jgi:hypothetical protein
MLTQIVRSSGAASMAKRLKVFLAALALTLVFAATADAGHWRRHHGWNDGWDGYDFRGYRGTLYGPGWAWRGPPIYYHQPYYYAAPACGYVRVRVWRHGTWRIRYVRRCW